jgi:hypothetical protein
MGVPSSPNPQPIEYPANRSKELRGDEIELKLQFAELPSPDVLPEAVALLRSSLPLEEWPNAERREIVLHYDYFAADNDGVLRPAFVVRHSAVGHTMLGRKSTTQQHWGPRPNPAVVVLQRRVERHRAWHEVSEDEIADVVSAAAREFGTRIIPLPRLTRTAYRTVLQNSATRRGYEVAVDYSDVLGHRMAQFEAEYIWCIPDVTPELGNLDSILGELFAIGDTLLASPIGPRVTPTTRSKFDWVVEALGSPG